METGRTKATAVFSYLLLTQQTHRREALAALFWPDYDSAKGRADLSRILSVLRKTLGEDCLISNRQTVSVNAEAHIWLDVGEFRHYLAQVESHRHANDHPCESCLAALVKATDLYQGDFMAGFTLADSPGFDDWQAWQSESLRQELSRALEKVAQWQAIIGHYHAAIQSAQRRLNLDPLHEPALRQLIRIHAAAGDRNAALRQYEASRKLLESELGLPPEKLTRELHEAILFGQIPLFLPAVQVVEEKAAVSNTLPTQSTPFIGRQEELHQIATLLSHEPACRLLTLVGPGGVGKTRLAIQAARQMMGQRANVFPDGIYYISLVAVSRPDRIIATITQSMNLSFSGRSDLEIQLHNYLSSKTMLLVIDNLEHLLSSSTTTLSASGSVIKLITTITRRAPRVKLLLTSRERLNLQEEWAMEVSGLPYPSSPNKAEDQLASFDAVNLFLGQARRARASFRLEDEEAQEVIRICQLVAGSPLGLELAASWVRMMSCQQIAQEIERNLDFLTTHLRDVPQRHRSLRIVFEQSWSHLAEEESVVFKKLSVFRGGFRLRAAERIAGATLPLISALVDKSLVRRTQQDRYKIHELLGQFAAEKLAQELGEWEKTESDHAEYFASFMNVQGQSLRHGNEPDALAQIQTEIDNILAGWQCAVTHAHIELIHRYHEGLALFHEIRGMYHEGLDLLRAAEGVLNNTSLESVEERRILAKLMARQASINFALTRYESATKLLEESLIILLEIGATDEMGYPLRILGDIRNVQGYAAQAEWHYRQSLIAYEARGDRPGIAWLQNRLAWLGIKRGQFDNAEELLTKCLRYFRKSDHRRGLIWALNDRGFLLRRKGLYQDSQQSHLESLQISEGMGFRDGIAWSLWELADAQRDSGFYLQARQNLERSLAIYRELGSLDAALVLYRLGYLLILHHEPRPAETYLVESLAAYRTVGSDQGTAITLCFLAELALLEGDERIALDQLQKSMRLFDAIIDIGKPWGMMHVYKGLGRTYLSLGELKLAHEAFRKQIELAQTYASLPNLLSGLIGFAAVFAQEGQSQKAGQALAISLNQQATRYEDKVRARLLLDQINIVPSATAPGSLSAATQREQVADLWSAVIKILA